MSRRLSVLAASTAALALALSGAAVAPLAQAESTPPVPRVDRAPSSAPSGEPSGEPWVVSLGDSYISGEAGRWAGNESGGTSKIDALGPAAYWDAGSGESIERCHRSRSAVIHIGVVRTLNLACSGAITETKTSSDGYFKPGIDFFHEGSRKGQALMLQEFAAEHNVKMVALSISGNDFKFAPIFEACVKAFLVPFASPHCKDDPKVQAYLSESAQQSVRAKTAGAILNVATAMENAGYGDSDWTLVLQMYPQPLPTSANMRYGESGYSRQYDGGCGLRNGDLDWALGSVLPMINRTYQAAASDAQAQRPTLQVAVLETSGAFADRELCSRSVHRVDSKGGVANWQEQGAADRSEWVMEINIINAGDTYGQESLHPNYWGQLALRNCWRQVWNGGDVRGGSCQRAAAGGVTADCEPNMTLLASRTTGPRSEPLVPAASTARVTLRCPGITVRRGASAILRGQVSPRDAATKVTLQVSLDGRVWKDVATQAPTRAGAYRFTTVVPRSAPEGRAYSWRVVAQKGSRTLAVSQVRTSYVR